MPLPKIDQPLFEMTIPSSNKKVKYRPFTVKEEKVLLIAQESEDTDQAVLSMKQIINNCLIDVDVDELAVFDIEYIMLKLRAKAVNNVIDFKITDPDTEEEIQVELDINDIEISRDENHKKLIPVTDTIQLKLKYPCIDYIKTIGKEVKQDEALFDLMNMCIESVVEGETVYKLKEFSTEEINEFIDGLGSEVISEIKHFFDTIPQMKFEHKYINKNGDEKTFVAKGTETFFI